MKDKKGNIKKINRCSLFQKVEYEKKTLFKTEQKLFYEFYYNSYLGKKKKYFKELVEALQYIEDNHRYDFIEFMNEKGKISVLSYKDVFNGGEEIKNHGEFTGVINNGKKYIKGGDCYYVINENKQLYIDEKRGLVFEYDKIESAISHSSCKTTTFTYFNEGEIIHKDIKMVK